MYGMRHNNGVQLMLNDKTTKLYYADSHLSAFSGTVLSCEPRKGGFEAVLDQTAFYPEGGGQPYDTGYLGEAVVSGVHERGGVIYHYVDKALPVGGLVEGRLDYERRFRLMQNHSGEHILSGVVLAMRGYDNVGFHMGEDIVTIDFSGELSWEELMLAEKQTNEAVYKNLEFEVFYPSPEELKSLDYRSKKELTGDVRIVKVGGYDACACCGTHVKRSGEIGIVKILSSQRYKGGVRVSLLSGKDALEDYNTKMENTLEISTLLSAKPNHAAKAVHELHAEAERLKSRVYALTEKMFESIAESADTSRPAIVFEDGLSADELRRLSLRLSEKCPAAYVFTPTGEGYKYALSSKTADMLALVKALNASFSGKGGGSAALSQGSIQTSSKEEISSFISCNTR